MYQLFKNGDTVNIPHQFSSLFPFSLKTNHKKPKNVQQKLHSTRQEVIQRLQLPSPPFAKNRKEKKCLSEQKNGERKML